MYYILNNSKDMIQWHTDRLTYLATKCTQDMNVIQ